MTDPLPCACRNGRLLVIDEIVGGTLRRAFSPRFSAKLMRPHPPFGGGAAAAGLSTISLSRASGRWFE